ncbi:MAG: WD40 repeat domain-containing protein [Acidobacteriota bacterium]
MYSPAAVIAAHGRHAQAVRFTSDGKLLVSVGQDARIRLWSVPDFAAAGTFEGHSKSVNSISFSTNGRTLATGSTDKTVRVWSFPDGRCLHTLEEQLVGLFAPDDDRLATISVRGQVVGWDSLTAERLWSIPALDKRTTAIEFSPDGKSLLIAGTGPIQRMAVADGKKEGELAGHSVVVACLCVSPDGKLLASTGGDGYLRLWLTKDWSEMRVVKLVGTGVLQIAFSPQSDYLALAADYAIQCYGVADGAVVDRIEVPIKGLYGIAISPDGKYLANAAADGKVRIWERS